MKTIAGYTLMGFGVYYILVELGGISAIFGLFKSAKQYMPQYQQQIAQIEKKIAPQLQPFSTPNPTPTLLPNKPVLPSPQPEAQWEFKLKTPWSKLETKANAR